jgi:hypothetical protein
VGGSTANGIFLHKIYTKHQDPDSNYIYAASTNFVYVPNLNEAFSVTKNTLFKIMFQADILFGTQMMQEFVQIMVNDYLIIDNSLLPNTADRVNQSEGKTLEAVDGRGGSLYFKAINYANGAVDVALSMNRVAIVYLQPGTYTFNVGVRTNTGSPQLRGGMVTFELTQFEKDEQNVGDYKLMTIPRAKLV